MRSLRRGRELISRSFGMRPVVKFNKYWMVGMREYWLIDLKKEEVIVYEFEKGARPVIYSFSDQIPLGISAYKLAKDIGVPVSRIQDILHGRRKSLWIHHCVSEGTLVYLKDIF